MNNSQRHSIGAVLLSAGFGILLSGAQTASAAQTVHGNAHQSVSHASLHVSQQRAHGLSSSSNPNPDDPNEPTLNHGGPRINQGFQAHAVLQAKHINQHQGSGGSSNPNPDDPNEPGLHHGGPRINQGFQANAALHTQHIQAGALAHSHAVQH